MKETVCQSVLTRIVSPVRIAPRPPAPVAQCRTALPGEMAAALHQRQPGQHLLPIPPEPDCVVRPADPALVVRAVPDRHAAEAWLIEIETPVRCG